MKDISPSGPPSLREAKMHNQDSSDLVGTGRVGYVLMEYPRVSESFIINEIYQLERAGVGLHLYSVKRPKEKKVQENVGKISAPVVYLPPVTSLSGTWFFPWILSNLPRYIRSHISLFLFRPRSYLHTLREAVCMAFRYRELRWCKPKKVFIKEFLQAGFLGLQILKSRQIDHLHAHFCHGTTTIAMFASRMTGVSFSFTAHAKDIYLKTLNPGDLLQLKMARAKFIVTCTDYNRQYLNQVNPNGATVHTVYHGLAPAVFRPKNLPDPGIPLILSVGRFVEKKGFPYLVRACRVLLDQGHIFHCRIIGDPGDGVTGDETPLIQELIGDLGLEGTVFLAPGVTQEELKNQYQQCTVFALPCQVLANGDRDGIPNVVAEAMATGVPVVSTAISGIPELIAHGKNGLLVPERDPQALANAIETLLVNPSLRTRLGEEARRTICEVFDSEKTTRVLQQLMQSTIHSGTIHVSSSAQQPT